jgi:prepilin-type N-terminal cleavage/methylation domain-containing protein/prepilin-type processing-associated H-X9-DG protein
MSRRAFTLVELLVVVAIVAALALVVTVAARRGLQAGSAARCAQNLHNLHLANATHAATHGHHVPAAADLLGRNLHRWHGVRATSREAFRAEAGPLAGFLGGEGGVRRCPDFLPGRHFRPGFETANGGYGYNAVGLGSTAYLVGFSPPAFPRGLRLGEIEDPAGLLAFGDAAFAQPYARPDHLIEYSFLEPPRHLAWQSVEEAGTAQPSLHFRHAGRVNLVWADGHASRESPAPRAESPRFPLGWFGHPPDNQPFRPW